MSASVSPIATPRDSVYRMLEAIFEKLQSIEATQIKQCDVAKETCARLTILEGKMK